MRKSIGIGGLLLVLIISVMGQAVLAQEPVATTFWVHRSANIRSEPTTAGGESTIIVTARRGEQLSVLGKVIGEIPAGWRDNGIWYVVQLSNNKVGYVYSALVAHFISPPQGDEGSVQDEPLITGSEGFKTKIRDALRLLRDRDAEMFAFVNKWLDEIIEGIYSCQRVRGESIALIGLNCINAGKSALASTLVHEACHAMRGVRGLVSGGLAGERACLRIELETLRAIDPHNRHLAEREKVYENIEERVCQWWRLTFNKKQCLAIP